jgi:predicted DNA helicase
MTDSTIIRDFVAKQRELLDLELQTSSLEERELSSSSSSSSSTNINKTNNPEEQEERASHVLGHLEASDISVGMYGRTVVQLTLWMQAIVVAGVAAVSDTKLSDVPGNQKGSAPPLLPAHRFTVGDEVEIRSKKGGGGGGGLSKHSSAVGGVISAVTDTFVAVALFQDQQSSSSLSSLSVNSSSSQRTKQKKSSPNRNNSDDVIGEENDLLNMAPLTLVPKSSVQVHKKLLAALEELECFGVDHPLAGPVIHAMFVAKTKDSMALSALDQSSQPNIRPFNSNLDQSQLEAIEFALQPDRPVALIHGPPGTGKTTTIAELIQQAVHCHDMRVLVTAPSNVAVDNILERLVSAEEASQKSRNNNKNNNIKTNRIRTVRLGHPARIKSSILSHSLEHLVQTSEGTEIVRGVRQELQSFLKILANPRGRREDKRVAYRQIKSLRKEVRVREEKVVKELITAANVVLATTVGAGAGILNKFTNLDSSDSSYSSGFDLVVIDEAAQALEASCWIPILRGRKVILAGDHKQLPPTIKSKDRKAMIGLSHTMFERLMKLYSNDEKQISRMLQIQYRMNHHIAEWASQAMYNGELQTHDSVRNRTLGQLTNNTKSKCISIEEDDDISNTVLLLVDTAGCDMYEVETAAGSRLNEGEARVVCQHVRKILNLGVEQNQIAVITPYNGQVELLRSMLLADFPKLEIRSVDGFQGGEREAVILSLVRSSERGGKDGIGFLRDDRRQNVAATRAKRHLAVVCDSETVSKSSFIANLIVWIERNGEYRSAFEYLAEHTSNQYPKQDFHRTESGIMKMVESSNTANLKGKKTPLKAYSSKRVDQELETSKRKALLDKVSTFSETGKVGEEMVLSSELSSYDRRLVHEFAEQLGLGHQSKGTEGVDRQIVLAIQKKQISVPAVCHANAIMASESIRDNLEPRKVEDRALTFSALELEESDSDEELGKGRSQFGGAERNTPANPPSSNIPATNSLLGQLAQERSERDEQRKQQKPVPTTTTSTKTQKAKKKSGQKLGGSRPRNPVREKDENLDDLDDMAFLDAEIEKVENAHGRKVAGSGKQYKTIVNGILNARPEIRTKPKNTKASSSLQAKLREAENARKKKVQKNK